LSAPAPIARPALAGAFPALFVVLWSTGFIAAKYGLPYAPPLAFLLVRFVLVAVLMAVVAVLTGATWPSRRETLHVVVAGVLVHAVYLGGVLLEREPYLPNTLSLAALILLAGNPQSLFPQGIGSGRIDPQCLSPSRKPVRRAKNVGSFSRFH